MVGHLLPNRYHEATTAYFEAANAVVKMSTAARMAGWSFIITADHGNIENDTSAHSVNDILTTVITGDASTFEPAIPVFQARLFDISPTLLALMGCEQPGNTSTTQSGRFRGRPLVGTG
jgi:bisphosphoglycerate-independent phosphoglycerate mutase (AlkP superfamily)